MRTSMETKPAKNAGVATVRCAIYTRKSSEQGLEQEFNSLHAQRESGEAYVASMKHEGWVALPDQYNDGGFTGGNTDRPGCQRPRRVAAQARRQPDRNADFLAGDDRQASATAAGTRP